MGYFHINNTDQAIVVPDVLVAMFNHLDDHKWTSKKLFQFAVDELKNSNDSRYMTLDETLETCPDHQSFTNCLVKILNARENGGVFYTGTSNKEVMAPIEFSMRAYQRIYMEKATKQKGEEPEGYAVHKWDDFSINSASRGDTRDRDLFSLTMKNLDEMRCIIKASKSERSAIEAVQLRYDLSETDSFLIVGFVTANMAYGRGEI